MKTIYFRNTSDHQKNIFPYMEKYLQSKFNQVDEYEFYFDYRCVFTGIVKNNNFYLIPSKFDHESLGHCPQKKFPLDQLIQVLDEKKALYLVTAHFPENVTDIDLINRAQLVYQDNTGELIEYESEKPLSTKKPVDSMMFLSAMKIGKLPYYVFFFHSPVMHTRHSRVHLYKDYTINTLPGSESLRDRIFPCHHIKGIKACVGKHYLFSNENEIIIQLLDKKESYQITKEDIKVETDLPYRIESNQLIVDLSSQQAHRAIPLNINFNSNDFFKDWIYHSQRFNRQYMVYKDDA